MEYAQEECPKAIWFKNIEALSTAINLTEMTSKAILIKGSRGVKLERLVEGL
jgi:UDP-N-acetylmuramyl pentapeptide synthase